MNFIELTSYGGVPTEADMGGRQVAEEFALLAVLALTRGHRASSKDVLDAHKIIVQEVAEEALQA